MEDNSAKQVKLVEFNLLSSKIAGVFALINFMKYVIRNELMIWAALLHLNKIDPEFLLLNLNFYCF